MLYCNNVISLWFLERYWDEAFRVYPAHRVIFPTSCRELKFIHDLRAKLETLAPFRYVLVLQVIHTVFALYLRQPCMSCRNGWNREHLEQVLTKSFLGTTFKKCHENLLFDRQISMLPGLRLLRRNESLRRCSIIG